MFLEVRPSCMYTTIGISVSCNQGLGIVLTLRWIQTDKPLSGYDRMSETIQAYAWMTFTAAIMPQNICGRV